MEGWREGGGGGSAHASNHPRPVACEGAGRVVGHGGLPGREGGVWQAGNARAARAVHLERAGGCRSLEVVVAFSEEGGGAGVLQETTFAVFPCGLKSRFRGRFLLGGASRSQEVLCHSS